MSREDDFALNEDGTHIRSVNDYCSVDGLLHQPLFDKRRGERICGKCGLVMQERMIIPEYSGVRSFSSDERSRREHSAPVNALIPDMK